MPANLSQQYRNAEKKYRKCDSPDEELECLQLMLREIPKHKGTDKLQADIKRKISKLKEFLQNRPARKSTAGFRLPRQGAGRVVVIGGPNSGKSSLVTALTDSQPEVAEFPFTTRHPLPGLMPVDDIKIQLVDTPPITSQNYEASTEALVRGADLVLCLIDLATDESIDDFGDLFSTVQNSRSRIDRSNRLDESDVGVTYSQAFLVWTKIDSELASERQAIFKELIAEKFGDQFCRLKLPEVEFAVSKAEDFESLKRSIWESLEIVRVYTKDPQNKEPDFQNPMTLTKGAQVIDLASLIHQELAENFHSARLWRTGKHDATTVNGNFLLEDRDIVEIKTR